VCCRGFERRGIERAQLGAPSWGSRLGTLNMPPSTHPPRRRVCFNSGWRFFRGDAPDAGKLLDRRRLARWQLPTSADLIEHALELPQRPSSEPHPELSFIQPSFDDSGWRELGLPHDWGIEGPFNQALAGETGKLPWAGVGWYRKTFALSRKDEGSLIELYLDGAMSHATIWLNGACVGGWVYGYTSFKVDLTPAARFGRSNVLAVRLDNPDASSRWYPGSGLYRNTWLVKTNPIRFRHDGIFVSTPEVAADAAWVNVDVELENKSSRQAALCLRTVLYRASKDGTPGARPVASSKPLELELAPGARAHRSQGLAVPKPRLWSPASPERYLAVNVLEADGEVVDRVETLFGIRSLRVDARRGLFINGEHVAIQGVCQHHDLGPLGAALNERALERQLRLLMSMGCNAIRTAHNPPAPELPELCDRLGVLLMVEAFDCWRRGKKTPEGSSESSPGLDYLDYARAFDAWHEQDLRAMVRRDRNHPSVVMWSIGNEVLEQWSSDGWMLAKRLAGIVREEDRSRPITSGFNSESSGDTGFQTAVDLVGFNYKPKAYAEFQRKHPSIPVLGTETASTVSSRGEYFFPVSDDPAEGRADFQVSSYDLYAPPWAFPPDSEFRGLDEAPGALGEFVWTGFDYLGEPTPYNSDATSLLNFSDGRQRARLEKELSRLGKIRVPSRSSYFGIIDLAGFPKDRFYLYQARWRPELRMAHILPHWNWPERLGEVTPVHVYSSGDEAELFLNGVSQGRRRREPLEYRFRWNEVRYEPGKLEVVTYRHGKRWATAARHTSGEAARLRLHADPPTLRADGIDLCFTTVSVEDKEGRLVPRSSAEIAFSLTGPGEIVAVDNGDATSLEPFARDHMRAFNGLGLVIVRSRGRRKGRLVLTARSHGLARATLELITTAPANANHGG
jgi:beta-galactosidase